MFSFTSFKPFMVSQFFGVCKISHNKNQDQDEDTPFDKRFENFE